MKNYSDNKYQEHEKITKHEMLDKNSNNQEKKTFNITYYTMF